MAQTVVATVAVGNTPIAVAVNPVTHKIYVVNHGSNSVTIIDGATRATSTVNVEDRPEAVAVNPVTNKVYVTNAGADSVSVIDGATNAVSATVHVGSYPQAMVVNTATNKIYVANNFGHSVTVIDGAANATTTIQVGQGPRGIALNPVTNKVYTVNYGSQDVTVIDGATGATTSVQIGKHPWAIAVDPRRTNLRGERRQRQRDHHPGGNQRRNDCGRGRDSFCGGSESREQKAYVLSYGDDTMAVIDGTTNSVSKTVALGTHPQAIAIDEQSDQIYVANQSTASVTVIDGKTNLPVSKVDVQERFRSRSRSIRRPFDLCRQLQQQQCNGDPRWPAR
jgi:YVTN family beta-propeller protein